MESRRRSSRFPILNMRQLWLVSDSDEPLPSPAVSSDGLETQPDGGTCGPSGYSVGCPSGNCCDMEAPARISSGGRLAKRLAPRVANERCS